MSRIKLAVCVSVGVSALCSSAFAQASKTQVATYVTAAAVADTIAAAPEGRVSDQQIRHVDAGEQSLGLGVVQRPVKEMGTPLVGIQHHKQAEVYRVVSGAGTLVTADRMVESKPLDPDGQVVRKLTGPSSSGRIEGGHSQHVKAGDFVIIPAGVAHGFSEITETITYVVVRIDPEKLVELK